MSKDCLSVNNGASVRIESNIIEDFTVEVYGDSAQDNSASTIITFCNPNWSTIQFREINSKNMQVFSYGNWERVELSKIFHAIADALEWIETTSK